MPRADRCHLCTHWKLLVPTMVASSQPGDITSQSLAPACLCTPTLFSSVLCPVVSLEAAGQPEDNPQLWKGAGRGGGRPWRSGLREQATNSCNTQPANRQSAGKQRPLKICTHLRKRNGGWRWPFWDEALACPCLRVEGGTTLGLKLSRSDKLHVALTRKYDAESKLPLAVQTHFVKILTGLCLQNCFIINSFLKQLPFVCPYSSHI